MPNRLARFAEVTLLSLLLVVAGSALGLFMDTMKGYAQIPPKPDPPKYRDASSDQQIIRDLTTLQEWARTKAFDDKDQWQEIRRIDGQLVQDRIVLTVLKDNSEKSTSYQQGIIMILAGFMLTTFGKWALDRRKSRVPMSVAPVEVKHCPMAERLKRMYPIADLDGEEET